jgi:methyl-accepting chemotaxis protein
LLGTMAVDNQAQSSTITQITAAIDAMDQSTQQNAAMVEETSAAARNLTTEVGSLAEQAAMFKVDAKATKARLAATLIRSAPAHLKLKKVSASPAAYRSPVKAVGCCYG